MLKNTFRKTLRFGANKLRRSATKKAIDATKFTAKATGKIADIGATAVGHQVKQVAKGTVNLASTLIREDKSNSLIGLKFKKRGFALVAGASMIGAAAKETKSYVNEDLRGRVDTYTTPISPQINSGGYQNFGQQAGATGDLVFALNRNRRG